MALDSSNREFTENLRRIVGRFAPASAMQIVAEQRQSAHHGRVEVAGADGWLAGLTA